MDFDSLKDKKIIATVLISVTVGFLAGYAVYDLSTGVSQNEASSTVEQVFSAQGQDVDVASVEKESQSIYRVIVETSSGLENVFISRDGQYFLNNPVKADEFIELSQNRTDFVNCLSENNVTVLGSSNQRQTQLQLQILGGQGLESIYSNVNNQTAQQLANQGVEQLPVTVYNGELYPGVQSMDFYSQQTGCSM